MPWVVERPAFRDRPVLRCFAIDCEPLRLRQVWALIGPVSAQTEAAGTAHVVVPNWLADHVQGCGDGTVVHALGERHALVTLQPDPGPNGIERVCSLLLLAYAAVFT